MGSVGGVGGVGLKNIYLRHYYAGLPTNSHELMLYLGNTSAIK